MKRTLLYVLAFLMVLFIFAGCDSNTSGGDQTATAGTQTTATEQPTAEPTENPLAYLNLESTMPIINEGYDVTLEVVGVQGDSWTATPKDHWIWAFFEEYCNLGMDVTYYQYSSWAEQRNLLFTSGDLPDVFCKCLFSTSDTVKYGVEEGMLLPLEDLITGYAPLIVNAIAEYPVIQNETMASDGHEYFVPCIINPDFEYPMSTSRYFINQSWIDTLGLSTPETLSDLITVLTAFKNGDPNGNGEADEVAWLGYGGNAATVVLTAFGINAKSSFELYIKNDGTVAVGATEENYVYYLEYMKQILAEELLDPDYYTMTSEENNALLSQGVAGLSLMSAPDVYLPEPEQYTKYEALSPLTSDYNSEKVWPIGSQLKQGQFGIAYDTDYPEACIRMANVFFIEEAPILFWEGSFYTEYAEPIYEIEGWDPLQLVYENNAWTAVVPEGCSSSWAYVNEHIATTTGYTVGFSWDPNLLDELCGKQGELDAGNKHWRTSMSENVVPYEKLTLPTLFLNSSALERVNELYTPLSDYIKTMEAKFIMGEESLDNIDDFYAELETLGIDEYLQIYQEAYDTYLANIQ